MKILFLYADEATEINCSQWRCIIPAQVINETGEHEARCFSVWDVSKQDFFPQIEWADLIVVERLGWGPVAEFIRLFKAMGKKVILDFDDAYHLMPSSVSTHILWRANYTKAPKGIDPSEADGWGTTRSGKRIPLVKKFGHILAEFRRTLKMVDAFSTPSELLTADFANLNLKHYVIRNYPDLSRPEWHTKKKDHGQQVVIGWGGSATHYESFRQSGIISALNQVIRQYPFVRFWICAGGQATVELLRLPPEKLVVVHHQPFREWPLILDHFDIGIAPLAGKYDDRRSWIKVLEYAAKGIPWLATDAPPYQGCKGGLLVKNKPKHWYRCLMNLIESHELRSNLSSEGQRWARGMGIDDHIGERLGIYEEVLGS